MRRHLSTVVVFISIVIMCGLSIWQVQRGLEKQQRLDMIKKVNAKRLMSLDDVESLSVSQDLLVTLVGKPVIARVFLLDNRIRNSVVGYEVLVPVNTQSGTVVVNMGWVKAERYRQQLPPLELTEQEVFLEGRVSHPSVNPMVKETLLEVDTWPAVIQAVDMEKLSQWLGQSIKPYLIVATDDTFPHLDKLWKPVVMPPEKHYAYALQWLCLAIAAFVVSRQLKNSRRKQNENSSYAE